MLGFEVSHLKSTPKFLLFSYSKFALTNHLATNSNIVFIATFCTALGYLLYRPIATFCTGLSLPIVPVIGTTPCDCYKV
jgi:hypothetical protein